MAQQARLTPPNPSASELIFQTLSLTTLASHRHAPALALDHTLPKMLFQAALSGDCQVGKSVDLESHKTACDLHLDPGSAAYQPCSLEQIL